MGRAWLDCEGAKLSRAGTVENVSLCFQDPQGGLKPYLVDMVANNGVPRNARLLIKSLLESPSVLKIIHDPRMDSDALYHLHGITFIDGNSSWWS